MKYRRCGLLSTFGPCTTFVGTEGKKVKMYQLNQNNEFEFISNLSGNKNSKIYSVNESHFYLFISESE